MKPILYQLVDGKIYNPIACEINVVYHCNLSCRACSHLSPILTKHFVAPSQVFSDFSILAKYYNSKSVKIVGGEPLLHPNLAQIIDALRRSGICKYIQVATNGQLLPKMTDLVWQKIDEIYISIYPGKELSREHLKKIEQKARLYNVALEYYYFDKFRESYSELGTRNSELVQRIYSTCKIAHIWRSHTIADGYFYKCPQSLFLPKIINKERMSPYKDGIKITDSNEFAQNLLAYLKSSEPLSSCNYCLGSVGKLFTHEQKPRIAWQEQQQFSTEELIDLGYLAASEVNPQLNSSCIRSLSSAKKAIVRTQRFQRKLARRLSRSFNAASASQVH